MSSQHPAVEVVLQDPKSIPYSDRDRGLFGVEHTTSLSLARALAIGCLSRLDPELTSVDIWDPAAGSGFAGFMLCDALESAGVRIRYRGQDINEQAVSANRRRFEVIPGAETALGNTLECDEFDNFMADLVIVDAPWGLDWRSSKSIVETRRESGEFGFGLPHRSDSTWLFISLALEKLRPSAEGGGRVAALVNPGTLWSGASGTVRRRIVEGGLVESVTRLPDGLSLSTSIPLYLVTFTNRAEHAVGGRVMVADMQTQFVTERQHRSMPVPALRDLESGLRTGNPGPRNRTIHVHQFIRRQARLSRVSNEGRRLSWGATTHNNTRIDDLYLESRYGPNSGVSIEESPQEDYDLDPSHVFGDDSREILKDMAVKGWPSRRLTSILASEPLAFKDSDGTAPEGHLYVPTTRDGKVSAGGFGTAPEGRVLCIRLDGEHVEPAFLAAWLNSEQGIASRRRAIEGSSSGMVRALRSDSNSLMRWADELIIPVPDTSTQLELASADERLVSFQSELTRLRDSVWISPQIAEEVVSRIAGAFDDSLSNWLDQLPFPIASALWTAETAQAPGEQQRAYLHAWEAIVTFHATVLLSASRSDPGSSSEVEAVIRETLQRQHIGIERASFGTWVVIVEKTSKELRMRLRPAMPMTSPASAVRSAIWARPGSNA